MLYSYIANLQGRIVKITYYFILMKSNSYLVLNSYVIKEKFFILRNQFLRIKKEEFDYENN